MKENLYFILWLFTVSYKNYKRLIVISWNERNTTPSRVFLKSYAREQKHGKEGMSIRLSRELCKISSKYTKEKREYIKSYKDWIYDNEMDILKTKNLDFMPLISIVTPTYNTDEKYLKKMLDSVLAQTYMNWELCIADDASSNKKTQEILTLYQVKYDNIKVVFRKENGHISEATNSALSLINGKYVAFLDHDDTLSPNALYEMVKKLNENRQLKLIYSDEDKIDEEDNRYSPHFKSGWNPDMFYSQNYICHLTFIEKKILDNVGGFRKGYEGSQDYDLLLRVIEQLKDYEIGRVEKVLYHWRAIKGSTAYNSNEKSYAHEAGLKALQSHFLKKNKKINVVSGLLPNTYKVNYPIPEDAPLVSLLIPTRDGYEVLSKCIESILEKTVYKNYEIVILDNQTTCKKTLKYFKKIKKHNNIRIIAYHKKFNYSAINNFAVKHAKGTLIGLINNDVEVISENWLTEMVQYAIRPNTGAVGAKLYYDNNNIQHAGVVLGIGGVAGHSHKYFEKNEHGYFSRLKIVQNYSAVTGACLLIRKELYNEVSGLDEKNLTVAFNDVDFCLKLLEKGYLNIWTPYVELYHHESVSRGAEDNPLKIERFNAEVKFMKAKWDNILGNDKYYHKNLTKEFENFDLYSSVV